MKEAVCVSVVERGGSRFVDIYASKLCMQYNVFMSLSNFSSNGISLHVLKFRSTSILDQIIFFMRIFDRFYN